MTDCENSNSLRGIAPKMEKGYPPNQGTSFNQENQLKS